MNCDVNSLSQASSCYNCLPDDLLSAAKTSLLCAWANVAAGMMIPDLPSGLENSLVLRNEAFSFDGFTNGQAVTSWPDLSGAGHHWTIAANIFADTTRMAGTHPTVRFNGDGFVTIPNLQQPFFLPAVGITAMTVMGVYKLDADPPALNQEGCLVTFNHPINFPPHHPFNDGTWYECFGRNDRPSLGNPAMSVATAFRIYTCIADSAGPSYNAWFRGGGVTENFFSSGAAFTFQTQGLEVTALPAQGGPNYSMGKGYRYDITFGHPILGNIAALFLWTRALSAAERLSMWTYLETNYAV